MTQSARKTPPWCVRQRTRTGKVELGAFRTEGLSLPGDAFIALSSRATLFAATSSKDLAWDYPGFIVALKPNQRSLAPKVARQYIVSDIYAYLRQQWHIVSGLKGEKIRMSRSIDEARSVAKMLLEKGHCSQEQHDEIMDLILRLEEQFTGPDFRDEYKIRAGDLFMQIGVDPDPRPKKNAVHALTAYQGAARLEQRKHQTLIMLHYLTPRFLQVRGVVRQLEDRIDKLKQSLDKQGGLTTAYRRYVEQGSRATQYRLLAELKLFSETIDTLTVVLPFSPQAGLAKSACESLREIVAEGRLVDVAERDSYMKEMRFRVTLLRLLVRVERDIVLPLTVLQDKDPRAEHDEQRRKIFTTTQLEINLLLSMILKESTCSLSRLRDLEPWLAKLKLCTQNKFEDHRITRDDAKAFARYLMLAHTET